MSCLIVMVQLYFFYIKRVTHSNLIILVISKSNISEITDMVTEKEAVFCVQGKPKESFRKVDPNAEASIFYK